ncbi:MAG: hypothetical protein ACK549_01125 [Cyanobacteriota bacterium]
MQPVIQTAAGTIAAKPLTALSANRVSATVRGWPIVVAPVAPGRAGVVGLAEAA